MNLRNLLREPLIHFLVLGAALFLIGRANDDGMAPGTGRIVVTPAHIQQMAALWTRTWRRPPTERELEGLIEDYIREEVFYREALAMGLDRDDTVIRRRMRQKMEFLSEDIAESVEPTEDELQSYLRDHIAQYEIEPRFKMTQVFVSREVRGPDAERDAEQLLARLGADGASDSAGRVDMASLGDPTLLPRELNGESKGNIARLFGETFAERVARLEVGPWVGPVESSYGLHLVRIHERVEGRQPALDEVRDAVQRDWLAARRRDTTDELYQRLRQRYTVIVQRPESAGGSAQEGALEP